MTKTNGKFKMLLALGLVAACQPSSDQDASLPSGPEIEVRLADAPSSVIGTVEGADEYVIGVIGGGARLEDGSVVVALERQFQVRRYDSDGELQWSVGREGKGPGEWEFPRIASGCVGTARALVYDFPNRRITALTLEDGSIDEMWTWPVNPGPPYRTSCSPDGGLVFTTYGEIARREGPARPDQSLYSWQGGSAAPMLLRERLPGADRWSYGGGNTRPRPWGRGIHLAATPEEIWLSTGDAHEIEVLSYEGETTRVVRWAGRSLSVEREDISVRRDQYISARLRDGDGPDRVREVEESWRDYEEMLPEAFPSVVRMMRSSGGEGIWIQRFLRPRDASVAWLHFDNSGKWTRSLELPPRTRLIDIGPDWALVRVLDSLDRAVLHVYELVEAE